MSQNFSGQGGKEPTWRTFFTQHSEQFSQQWGSLKITPPPQLLFGGEPLLLTSVPLRRASLPVMDQRSSPAITPLSRHRERPFMRSNWEKILDLEVSTVPRVVPDHAAVVML